MLKNLRFIFFLEFWVEFFCEAGIPPVASANYAIIFSENRIQKHMLLDLNKEYLKDMGVNVLGDIIAILKHSKRHHEKVFSILQIWLLLDI